MRYPERELLRNHQLLKEPVLPSASDMLSEAAVIVPGARNGTRGSKERSFFAIAEMWMAYLRSRRQPGGPIRSAHD